jgi:hypothetical protein
MNPSQFCDRLVSEVASNTSSMDWKKIQSRSNAFFHLSCESMMLSIFDGNGATGFVSLEAASRILDTNMEEYMRHLADCAESEHGQQIFRDLILSFKLPRSVVGVRRTALLSRQSNTEATQTHAEVLTVAHGCAMRGTRWTWDHDDDEIHKTCALLAGIAVSMCSTSEQLRRADMFSGLVGLPFLKTRAPPPGTLQVALLPCSHEWVVYSTGETGDTKISMRVRGNVEARRALVLLHISSTK